MSKLYLPQIQSFLSFQFFSVTFLFVDNYRQACAYLSIRLPTIVDKFAYNYRQTISSAKIQTDITMIFKQDHNVPVFSR